MPRKTLIFGNGLGMAIDPNFYALDRALGAEWNSGRVPDDHKSLIRGCLPAPESDRPHGEPDLDALHLALSACDFLNGIDIRPGHWLSEIGRGFPDAVRRFIYNTAYEFHQGEEFPPVEFLDSLARFIRLTKSHIATLNYDNLLYQPMIERDILRGYDGCLVDGFLGEGFSANNLIRLGRRNFGCYLHLHGSPLFVDQGDQTIKLHQWELTRRDDGVRSHIVLTHIRHKPTVITSSAILQVYWQYLVSALSESEEILIFGYSGDDAHLNSVVRAFPGVRVRIVEWAGAGPVQQRLLHWRRCFGRLPAAIVSLDSILDFRDW